MSTTLVRENVTMILNVNLRLIAFEDSAQYIIIM
jgi:hypothetical protein